MRAAAAQLIYSLLCDGRLSSHGVCYCWQHGLCFCISKLSKQNDYLDEVQLLKASFARPEFTEALASCAENGPEY